MDTVHEGGRFLDKPWIACLLLENGLTVGASAFNAYYFIRYSSRHRRRRWGAFALALVNLALLAQSAYFGLLPYLQAGHYPNVKAHCIVGLLPLAASLLITIFILRRRKRRR
jgi:hypothetical protein